MKSNLQIFLIIIFTVVKNAGQVLTAFVKVSICGKLALRNLLGK